MRLFIIIAAWLFCALAHAAETHPNITTSYGTLTLRDGVTFHNGDSFTAADGVSNRQRYSDLLEARLPGIEVYNFGLPGTGTDQQGDDHEGNGNQAFHRGGA